MSSTRPRPTLFATALALVAGAALPTPALAQSSPDFLFKTPTVTFGLRAGYALPRAHSEIFDFTREQLTVNRSDFNAVSWGGQLGLRISERLDVALDVGYARSETRSEFRDWVDTNDLPIEQTTVFWRRPMTLSVKRYFRDRGRGVGRFVWVPATWAPYAGVGAGWVWYSFEQDGSFVDFETLDIFSTRFDSSGSTPTGHVFAGVDVSLGPRFLLTGEGRYSWARTELGNEFVNFDAIDLSGVEVTMGFSVRF